jgi:hypothetical protein
LGCATTAPPAPARPDYQGNFGYKAASSGQKLEVSIGVVNPQFSANSLAYKTRGENDPVFKQLVSSLGATFNEVLIAKGFNTKGPFASLNDMTFPDKKGSDLLLYPEFDFQLGLNIGNPHPAQQSAGDAFAAGLLGSTTVPTACDITLSVSGNVVFIVQEPLSGEKMWTKRLDVSKAPQVFREQTGATCENKGITQDIKESWVKAHEVVYQASMKALDDYVNGEEFQLLKKQSLELRAKKAY